MVLELFEPFVDGLFATRRLGELDRHGIDAVAFDDNGSLGTVIQCKGFEGPEAGNKQVKQCLAEIDKYKRKGLATSEYWLAINRPIKDAAARAEIVTKLREDIVTTGKAQRAILLDYHPLLSKMDDVAARRLAEWSEARHADILKERATHLGFVDYIDAVPFTLRNQLSHNPSHRFAELVQAERLQRPNSQFGVNRKATRIILTSSFGYGKTSTMLAAAAQLLTTGMKVIYIPATDLSKMAFSSGHFLVADIVRSVLPEQKELSPLAMSLATDALKNRMKSSDDWVLFLDALDENPRSNRAALLAALWGGIVDLGLPALVSIRSEVADQRQSELVSNPKPGKPELFEIAGLVEWDDLLIAEFLEKFCKSKKTPLPKSFVELQSLVHAGRYADFYGDIPKRPLFLGMLAEDAWSGYLAATSLHRLYSRYFLRKFKRDRAETGHMRPFRFMEDEGIDDTAVLLIKAMKLVAAHMLSERNIVSDYPAGKGKQLVGTVSKDVLDEILTRVFKARVSTVEFSSHSVLIPVSSAAGSGEPTTFKFAHSSFEDYFAALHLWEIGVSATDAPNAAVGKFVAEMEAEAPTPTS